MPKLEYLNCVCVHMYGVLCWVFYLFNYFSVVFNKNVPLDYGSEDARF